MATLSNRTPYAPTLPGLARIASTIAMVFTVFAEAQIRALAAHNRYPFAEW